MTPKDLNTSYDLLLMFRDLYTMVKDLQKLLLQLGLKQQQQQQWKYYDSLLTGFCWKPVKSGCGSVTYMK